MGRTLQQPGSPVPPGVSLSSDFIAGFCGETEADHQQTVSLLREVRYNTAFLFAYSMRQVSAQHLSELAGCLAGKGP